MFKKIAGFIGALATIAVSTPAQAQWQAFTANNDGAEFWDNVSADGDKCNIGFVVTGVAGTGDNTCERQRPGGWLPYTGTVMTEYLATPTFTFEGGSLFVEAGKGLGGDIAGQNRSWGFWTGLGDGRTFTNLNTIALPQMFYFGPSEVWGFWVNTGAANRTSDVDPLFALFRAGNQYVVGIEDTRLGFGDADYQDMVASIRIPEPSSVLLMAGGLVGLLGAARRRTRI